MFENAREGLEQGPSSPDNSKATNSGSNNSKTGRATRGSVTEFIIAAVVKVSRLQQQQEGWWQELARAGKSVNRR